MTTTPTPTKATGTTLAGSRSTSILGRAKRFAPSSRYASVLATLILLVIMFGIGASRYRNFASGQVVLNLFVDNAFLIVLAVGMTFVILTGGIDLSVGSVVALTTMIVASLAQAGWNPVVIIVIALLVGSVIGLMSGLIIHFFKIQPFIVTLATMFLARGFCYIISLDSIPITNPFFVSLAKRIVLTPGARPALSISPSVIIAILVVVIAFIVLHFTRTGRTV